MDILNFKNVSFSYDNSKVVLNNVNLNISAGDFIGLIGENGCGKSTILKLILSEIKPTSGEIIRKKGLKIGYVNQTLSTEEGGFPATVYEILSLGLSKRPFTVLNKNDKKRINETLELFSLTALKNHSINSLSGGQLQKVKIAKVLLSNPELIILDEPTTGIDQESEEVLFELIRHISAMKKTIILVTHKDNELKYTNRIIKLTSLGLEEIKNA